LDDALVKAGGFGRFQWLLLLSYIMASTAANFVLYNIDPLTDKPDYMCETTPGSGLYEECTSERICDSDMQIKWYVDEDSVDSLDNWVNTLDLMCEPEYKVLRMMKIYYFGEIIGCFAIARVPDLFGRKWPLAISTAF